ncbi:SRPBCC family protein [bacterium]|nr:SRPBCC family protein [bacterium]
MPKTDQSVVIMAPITEIWNRIRNFHDMSWAPNVIASLDNPGEVDGNTVGAKRVLNGVFHETLRSVDPNSYTITYSIDDGPSPVSAAEISNYVGKIHLSKSGDGVHVSWTSSWESKSEDGVEFCHGIYVALLGELKNSFN